MADGQLERQVVGMAMPLTGAQRIEHGKSRSTPAQPGPLSDQLQRHAPLTQARGGQHPLGRVAAVTEPCPQGLGHQGAGRSLHNGRNPRQHGQEHGHQGQGQQRQEPGPAHRAQHQRHGQHQGTPAVARLGEHQSSDQGRRDPKDQRPTLRVQTRLHQGCQRQRPHQRQPGGGDVGVIEQPRQAPIRLSAGGHMPDHQPAQNGPGPLPARPQLPKTGHQNGHRARHEPQRRTAPCRRLHQVGLKSPESPEERQPVGQARPGQIGPVCREAAQEHQHRRGDQRPVPAIAPIRPLARAAAQEQGRKQQKTGEQHAGGEQQHAQLEQHPAAGRRPSRPERCQPVTPGAQATQILHANTAVRPRYTITCLRRCNLTARARASRSVSRPLRIRSSTSSRWLTCTVV